MATGSLGYNNSKKFRFDYEFKAQAGGWLKFHEIPAVWQEARLRCHAEGAILVSPLSIPLRSAVLEFVKKKKGMEHHSTGLSIFTGVHATFSKGEYSSIEGIPLLRLAITWAPGEPDNYKNSESCLAMMVDRGTMADVDCNDVFSYVCYKQDTYLETNECGTTDPEYTLEPRTGSCYKFHKRGQSWADAYKTCVAEGAYLAFVNSELEAQIINEIFHKHDAKTIRSTDPYALGVGFRDWSMVHHDFLTIHGENLESAGFEMWYNQPDNSTKERTTDFGEFCGSFLLNARYNDFWCNVAIPFLCEMRPNSLQ